MFCLFGCCWLSCQYLPSDWLEGLLWGSLTRGSSPGSRGRRMILNSLVQCIVSLFYDVFFGPYVIYLILLWHDIACLCRKVPLNTNRLTNYCCCYSLTWSSSTEIHWTRTWWTEVPTSWWQTQYSRSVTTAVVILSSVCHLVNCIPKSLGHLICWINRSFKLQVKKNQSLKSEHKIQFLTSVQINAVYDWV